MAKVDASQLVDYLKNAGASNEDIPKLVMIAFYESNFDTEAKNTKTDSLGLFQINADKFFFKDGKPDETLKSFAGDIKLEEFEEKLKDPQYNTNFAVHYLDVIRKDLEDGESQFEMVKNAGNDPFGIWEAYSTYVKPYLESKPIPGRGQNDDEKMSDKIAGSNSYIAAYMKVNDMEFKNEMESIEVPRPTRGITVYDAEGNPSLVSSDIVHDVVKNTQYTFEPPSSNNIQDITEQTEVKSPEESEIEKEIKDVFVAHVYKFLQEQKRVFQSQVPKEVGSIESARIKSDKERE